MQLDPRAVHQRPPILAEGLRGYFPLPLQHGMTVAELAALFNEERHIGADMRVVTMEG